MAEGGKLLCTGESGLWEGDDQFALDLGVKCEGVNAYTPNYMIPGYDAVNGKTAYVMYQPSMNVIAGKGSVEALVEETYFNRTPEHFCSHRHTPNNPGADRPGAVLTENTGYIAWKVFADYADKGSYHLKELVLHMVKALLDPTVTTNLPDRGIVTFTKQEKESRYVAHLLFAHTTKRGSGVEVIEDILPLYEIKLDAKLPEPKRVYKVEYRDGGLVETDLNYKYENGKASVEVGKVELHAMVVFDV